MLLKHSFAYLFARGLPGALNFAALALYTRLLTPDEYGRYALLITGISLVDVIVFQWLRLVLLRFLQGQAQPGRFLGSILAQYFLLAAIVSILGLGAAAAWPDPVWQKMLILAVPLLVTHGAVELTLETSRARLAPARYGFTLGTKAAVALGSGVALARVGLGAAAPVLGLVIGQMVALLGFARHAWRGVSLHWPAPEQRRRQLAYGLPLILTFGLGWIVAGSDRLLLGWMMGEDAAGIYSAGYDLAFQSLTLALTIINTAAYPLAIRVLQEGGAQKAREQLAHNGELIIACALAGAATLAVLAPQIVTVLIGTQFRAGAISILPIVAVASAVAGIKAYHFDIAFHLGERSRMLVMLSGIAAILNVGFNLIAIPLLGMAGAAWGTLGAYGVALLLSSMLGRRLIPMPSPAPLMAKGVMIASAAALGACCPPLLGLTDITALIGGLFGAAILAGVAMLAMDLAGARTAVSGFIRTVVMGRWEGNA
jgi:O-antigen/teichoic acid export membrane protein